DAEAVVAGAGGEHQLVAADLVPGVDGAFARHLQALVGMQRVDHDRLAVDRAALAAAGGVVGAAVDRPTFLLPWRLVRIHGIGAAHVDLAGRRGIATQGLGTAVMLVRGVGVVPVARALELGGGAGAWKGIRGLDAHAGRSRCGYGAVLCNRTVNRTKLGRTPPRVCPPPVHPPRAACDTLCCVATATRRMGTLPLTRQRPPRFARTTGAAMGLDHVTTGKSPPDETNARIATPKDAEPVKSEVDKESGAIFVDRVLSTPMRYPCNSGYVPNTVCGDGDPADVMVILPLPLVPGSVIR